MARKRYIVLNDVGQLASGIKGTSKSEALKIAQRLRKESLKKKNRFGHQNMHYKRKFNVYELIK